MVHSDDKKRARLNVISHLLERVPYKAPARKQVELPHRKVHAPTPRADVSVREVPERF